MVNGRGVGVYFLLKSTLLVPFFENHKQFVFVFLFSGFGIINGFYGEINNFFKGKISKRLKSTFWCPMIHIFHHWSKIIFHVNLKIIHPWVMVNFKVKVESYFILKVNVGSKQDRIRGGILFELSHPMAWESISGI